MTAALCIVLAFMFAGVTSGEECKPWKCPTLPCSEPVYKPGKCCPVCPCVMGGRYFNIGDLVFTRDRCETCECFKGGIFCLPWPCPRADCPNPIKRPGRCCPECGCMVNGVFFELGYQVASDRVCDDCRCSFDGKVRCARMNCPPLDCLKPYSVRGECCKRCGCRDKTGTSFDFGPLPVKDKCEPCTCQLNGTITCEKPICPEITCSRRKQFTPEGECCPKCGCLDDSVLILPGQEMPIPPKDKCAISCACGPDGESVCTYPACPVPECENPILLPGECCPKCGCLNDKKKFKEFGHILDDPCQPCTCNVDGTITCSERQVCPPLKCVSGFYKPNATEEKVCCPKCKCKSRGNVYRPGQMFEGPKCMRCECHQFTGRVSCEEPDCSSTKLQCGNPTTKKGDCCPSCPDGPSCLYKKTAIRFGEYREIEKNVCFCAGDPWFPNAFCAPKSISSKLKKSFDKRWIAYGYPVDKTKKNKKNKIKE